MDEHSPGGYSWLGIAPEVKMIKSIALNDWEKTQLEHDRVSIHDTLIYLQGEIERYTDLCKKYEAHAGTDHGTAILRQIEHFREEIEKTSKKLTKISDEIIELTHHQKAA